MLFACIIKNILAIALPSLRISPLLLLSLIFASAVGGMQNSYFFMGLRSLKKIGELLRFFMPQHCYLIGVPK